MSRNKNPCPSSFTSERLPGQRLDSDTLTLGGIHTRNQSDSTSKANILVHRKKKINET